MSRFRLRDLIAEAAAGMLQRPGRSMLTAVGTVLGVGSFVAVLGLTSTAQGQISDSFNKLRDTMVTITDNGAGVDPNVVGAEPVDFPEDADNRVRRLHGAMAAGVVWALSGQKAPTLTARPTFRSTSQVTGTAYAASPGLFPAVGASVSTGRVFDDFHNSRTEQVAVIGPGMAARLGISQLTAQPAVFIDGRPYTVVGILSDTERMPELLLGVVIPRRTAERFFPPPDPSVNPAKMIVSTRLGAAGLVARQAPIALRPDRPALFSAAAPPDPRLLFDSVNTDLSSLFLILAFIGLAIGAVGITNTTLVAILERFGEIGLRRALGARPMHIAAQFLAETTILGALGGLVGTTVGVAVVVFTSLAKHWTAILNPATVLPAPLIGAAVGLIAGIYPSLRAASIEPLEALRR